MEAAMKIDGRARFALWFLLATPVSAQGVFREIRPISPPQRVWTVDSSGGADFTDLPPAVQIAGSGDVLLVAPGDYTAFVLDGKGLTILGDGGVPQVVGVTIVEDLPADEVVVLRSLALRHFSNPGQAVLSVRRNEGPVWIEDCALDNVTPVIPHGIPVWSSSTSEVVCVRTTVGPMLVIENIFPSIACCHQGLRMTSSEVHAFDSTFLGPSLIGGSEQGGAGAYLSNPSATLRAAGCLFQGGQGSPAFCHANGCASGGDGGPGLELDTDVGTPTVVVLDSALVGGAGGIGAPCMPSNCQAGGSGVPKIGPISTVPLPYRGYEVETPVRSGTSYELRASCEPGEFVWSVFSENLDPTYVPSYFGTQVSPLPLTLVFEGVADGAGALTKTVPIPPLTTLAGFEQVFAQGLFFDALNNAYLGSPSVLVVVN
jgi:hypothetical protein